MGKYSNEERLNRDKYYTPFEAVVPLIPHLPDRPTNYFEPCAGDGRLVEHLHKLAPHIQCVGASDIEPEAKGIEEVDILKETPVGCQMAYLRATNPPWSRPLLIPMIHKLRQLGTTWLLIDSNFKGTQRAREVMDYCAQVVEIGRVKWFEGSKHSGKESCSWYRFEPHPQQTIYTGQMTRAERSAILATCDA